LDLLGGFRLSGEDDRAIDVTGRKSRALLALVALAPAAETTRERLMGLLWSDRAEEQARNSLRQALVSLRRDIAGFKESPLALNGDRVALEKEHIAVDVLEFLEACAGTDVASLRRASELYRGPLLDGLGSVDAAFEEWLREARADLAARAAKAIGNLAALVEGPDRVVAAERLLALEPLSEAAHLLVMQAHLAQGDSARALRQYENCASLLKRELGIEPGIELKRLKSSLNVPGKRSVAPSGVAPDRKTAIAVLPFENMSGDPGQQYLSDGLTEDLIDRLSKYRLFAVIGRHSSFAFRDQNAQPREASERLAADYLVTGNVRKSDSRIRIAARLIDARTEQALWAEQYDRPLTDLIALQDEVAGIIAGTLATRLGIEVARQVVARRNAGGEAGISSFEHVLHGIWHFSKMALNSVLEARTCFERAAAINPENAEAYRWLSACHISLWFIHLDRSELVRAHDVAIQAVACDPASARCHTALGLAQIWMSGQGVDLAAASYGQAMALNPGDPDVLIELALFHTFAGDLAAARDHFARAYRLNPAPPPWFGEFRGVALFAEGRYAEAWPAFAAVPDDAWGAMYLLASLGHLEDRGQAVAHRTRIAAAGWRCDLRATAAAEPFRDPEIPRRLVAGIDKAMAL
jgi:TolB-like protein